MITTTLANANYSGGQPSIIGGYATASGQSTWAVSGANGITAGAITGLTTYSTAFTPGTDVDVQASAAIASTVVNSLRFNTPTPTTLSISGTLTVATGGILNTAAVGGSNVTAISGGSITSNAGELIVIQANTLSPLTISSTIVDQGATPVGLTTSGAGLVSLVSSNSFTGPTSIAQGTLSLMNQFALSGSTLKAGAPVFDSSVTGNAFSYRRVEYVQQPGPGQQCHHTGPNRTHRGW